jgi:CDP-diacylglycerol--serine O-phosphatidyltransferase
MVSTLRYRSFKGLDLRQRRSYIIILPIAVVFVSIGTHPGLFLLGLASLYTVSGPTVYLVGTLRRRHEPPAAAATGQAHSSP